MTISILAAAMLIQSAPASTAAQPQWTLAASDEDGEIWIDRASIRREGALHRFRARHKSRDGGTDRIKSVQVDYQLDCAGRTLAIESMEGFDGSGRSIGSRTIPADWLDKEPIYAGSHDENIYMRVCPPSARRKLVQRPGPPVATMIRTTPVPAPPPIMVAPPPPIMIAPPAPPPPPPPPRNYPAKRAAPVVPLPSLFSGDDYPAAALRAEQEGMVLFRMKIDKNGRVAACDILSSSGSSSLDSTTCRLISARAKFHPARNAKGKKVPDEMVGRILWRFPEEPAPPPTSPPVPQ